MNREYVDSVNRLSASVQRLREKADKMLRYLNGINPDNNINPEMTRRLGMYTIEIGLSFKEVYEDMQKIMHSYGLNFPMQFDAKLKDEHPKNPLTERQTEILREISSGLYNKEIAQKFYMAESTVKSHIRDIFRKLNVKSRAEAAVFYATNRELFE